jgi:hypothetical protein
MACFDGCATCTSSGNNSCLTCENNSLGVNYYKSLYHTICDTSCPDSQYIDNTNYPNVCVLCNYTCLTCNITNCLTCQTGFYLDVNKVNCISSCPTSYYSNLTTKKCQSCDPACISCSDNTQLSCYACQNNGTTNFYKIIGINQCASSCIINGQYAKLSTYTC